MTYSSYSAAEPVGRLVQEFHKLPGIGPKSAQRLTYHLVRMQEDEARLLAEAILAVKERIVLCSTCYNITESDPCDLCNNPARDQSRICVVEEALDVLAIERTGVYKGLFHVLHGVISPMNGIGPDDLKIQPLLARLKSDEVKEIVLATNPNLEGDSTMLFLADELAQRNLQVTRLARGLPSGSQLEFANTAVLADALQGRQDL